MRTFPAGLMFLAATPFIVVTERVEQPVIDGIATGVGAVLGGLGLVGAMTVALFNWPKRLVAPHHRHQLGLIAELLGKRSDPTPLPGEFPDWALPKDPRERYS